jgi:hypothetical protein
MKSIGIATKNDLDTRLGAYFESTDGNEIHKPTMASMVPIQKQIDSARSRSPSPCGIAFGKIIPVNPGCRGGCFTLNTGIALGHGWEHSCHVAGRPRGKTILWQLK